MLGLPLTMHNFNNVVWQSSPISQTQRQSKNGHKGAVVWFTGLSGAGKSTLAFALEQALFTLTCATYVLDGDNLRHGLCSDLGFSSHDRSENIRRVGELSRLMADAGLIVMSAFISPNKQDRLQAKTSVGDLPFLEVFCSTPLDVCESRDVKGLYKRARLGEIKDFTGVSSPYEAPNSPDIAIDTSKVRLDDAVNQLIQLLKQKGVLA
jgi:adenylylsulfate kinase